MQNLLSVTVFFIVMGCTATAQGPTMAGEETVFRQLMQTAAATKKDIAKLIDLSKQYTKKPGELAADLDKAIQLANRAKKLSIMLQDKAAINASLIALGIAYVEQDKGQEALSLVEQLDEPGKMELLLSWSGHQCADPNNRKKIDSAIDCANRVLAMAQAGGYVDFEIEARSYLNYIYTTARNYSKVIEQLHALLAFKSRKKPADVLNDYFMLSLYYRALGQLDSAVRYALEAITYGEKLVAPEELAKVYEALGVSYSRLGQPDKALYMFEAALQRHKIKKTTDRYWSMVDWIVQMHLALKQPELALQKLLRAEKEFIFYVPGNQLLFYDLLGTIYLELKQVDQAEKCYQEVIGLLNRGVSGNPRLYLHVGMCFYKAGRLQKSRQYLVEGLELTKNPEGSIAWNLYTYLYKIDSTNKDYASALRYLMKRKILTDSLQQIDKTKEAQALMLQFETEKKNKDLQLKEQEILLLSGQRALQQKDLQTAQLQLAYETEAKEQGIQLARAEAAEKDKSLQLRTQDLALLKKETLLKESNLTQANVTRNITVVGAGLLLIILSLVYYQYRLKRQMSITLESKNLALGQLLKEKEILLKEVHHRVKNNLHTIISLLETQSAFLTDDALTAIQNSQHRVYAMSLIHQKLYQVDHYTSVSMSTYLPELISYLKDSFGTGRQINFHTQIDDIELDVSQAIPIGLILNEAITNAIKYAFPGNRPGEVTITMKQEPDRQVCLTVADNGIGLTADWQSNTGSSLGLKLMQGLSGDIQGNFNIESLNGTRVSVQFKRETFGNTARKNVV